MPTTTAIITAARDALATVIPVATIDGDKVHGEYAGAHGNFTFDVTEGRWDKVTVYTHYTDPDGDTGYEVEIPLAGLAGYVTGTITAEEHLI